MYSFNNSLIMNNTDYKDLQLNNFNLNTLKIKNATFISIIGPKMSGKSTLSKKIVNLIEADSCVLFCNEGEDRVQLKKDYLHCEYIAYNLEYLDTFMGYSDENYEMKQTLVFDNIYDINEQQNRISMLSHSGEYLNTFTIFTTQSPKCILPSLRPYIDFLFVFKNYDVEYIKHTYQKYLENIISFETFDYLLDSLVGYQSLVIDKKMKITPKTQLQDIFFIYNTNDKVKNEVKNELVSSPQISITTPVLNPTIPITTYIYNQIPNMSLEPENVPELDQGLLPKIDHENCQKLINNNIYPTQISFDTDKKRTWLKYFFG